MTVEDIVDLAIRSTTFTQFQQRLWDYRREKARADEAEERLAAEAREANQQGR